MVVGGGIYLLGQVILLGSNILIEPCFVERRLNSSVNSIHLCQPAQSGQADIGRNFFLSVNF